MATYLKQQPSKKEETGRLVVAELLENLKTGNIRLVILAERLILADQKKWNWNAKISTYISRRSDTARGNQTSSIMQIEKSQLIPAFLTAMEATATVCCPVLIPIKSFYLSKNGQVVLSYKVTADKRILCRRHAPKKDSVCRFTKPG